MIEQPSWITMKNPHGKQNLEVVSKEYDSSFFVEMHLDPVCDSSNNSARKHLSTKYAIFVGIRSKQLGTQRKSLNPTAQKIWLIKLFEKMASTTYHDPIHWGSYFGHDNLVEAILFMEHVRDYFDQFYKDNLSSSKETHSH